VNAVRARLRSDPARYNSLFDQMGELARAGADALAAADYVKLGRFMNICHGLLSAIEVSTAELEKMIAIARRAGAIGAKLTGAGGGGSIVALCPGTQDEVSAALDGAGFRTIQPATSRNSSHG
ncbi:MAG: hydroxymethylglutaryl-CoA reductase, partial [Gammaproteobacteria bacterium]|nr:hydroxymethylglutaryl-CoA reductase [Gammaproteobacteria bacterium]